VRFNDVGRIKCYV